MWRDNQKREVPLNRLKPWLSVLTGSLLLSCQAPIGVLQSGGGQWASRAVVDDYPEIEAQISKDTVLVDENGTRVRQLPLSPQSKRVTFLTYKALDNNLGLTLPMHLNILEQVGSTRAVNVLAFTDDIGPSNTRRYYMRRDTTDERVSSPYAPAASQELDTSRPKTLSQSMKWAFGKYPSAFRWLDINNHGGGYYGIAQDDRGGGIMRLPQLRSALLDGSGGRKLDLLTFDACLMSSLEVAHELRDTAAVMVGSEDSSYALGMNYPASLATMTRERTPEALELSRGLVLRALRLGSQKALFTVSAIDMTRVATLSQAVNELADSLLGIMPEQRSVILRSLEAVRAFYVSGPDKSDFDHRDLNEVIRQLQLRVNDARVRAACQRVNQALFNKGGAIILSRSANEQGGVTRGLSIYLPLSAKMDPIYRDTAFAKETRWDELLTALNAN